MDFLNAPPVWAELRADTLHIFNGVAGEDLALKLDAEGQPDQATRTLIAEALARLAPRKRWQTRSPLWCALPARGVSIRRVRVPATSKSELRRVLQLQVEASFPIPPEDLAWGWFETLAPAVSGFQEIVVAAVRKQSVEPWAAAFAAAGFDPNFTLASVARTGQQQRARESFAALDLTARSADLAVFQDGIPIQVRALPWSLDRLAETAAREFAVDRAELERMATDETQKAALDQMFAGTATALIETIRVAQPGSHLLLTGTGPLLRSVAGVLERGLAPLRVIAPSETAPAPGRTDAVAGLQNLGTIASPLRLALPSAVVPARRLALPPAPMKWTLRAAAWLLALLLFPYAEAFIGRPLLQRRLAALQKDRARLGEIDRRLDFLEYLSDSEPPYLDAAFVVANAAPSGTKIDSLTLNRRGEVSLGGYAQPPPQAVEFRTRLIDSKFFSSVVVEELTPVQNNQRVNFRITAQWKGPTEREALQLGPVLPIVSKTNGPTGTTNTATPVPSAKSTAAVTNPPVSAPHPN